MASYIRHNRLPREVGGGISIVSSSPTIQNCVISGNMAHGCDGSAGGGIFLNDSMSLIENCIISNNETYWSNFDDVAETYGAGIYLFSSDATIRNCVISGNYADWGNGAGVFCYNSAPAITNCKITENESVSGGSGFGGYGGGICGCNSPITDCEIIDNYGEYNGGGLSNCGGPITNCTISGNSVYWSGIGGGLYQCVGSITNCIIWDNDGDQLYDSSTPTYSCIQDWTGGGIGNIDADPNFVDPANGDYHLQSQSGRWDPNTESWILDDVTSPCIDAGDPNSDYWAEPWPNGHRVNMGAYGNTTEASRGCTNIDDVRLMGTDWLYSDSVTDIIPYPDGDGIVDLRDYAFLFEHWLCQEQ